MAKLSPPALLQIIVLFLLAGALVSGCSRAPESPSDEAGGGPTASGMLPVRLPAELTASYTAPELDRVRFVVSDRKLRSLYRQPSLPASLALIRDHDADIRGAAEAAGMPAWLLRGLVVLEAGGSADAIDHVFMRGRGRYAHVGLCQIGPYEAIQAGIRARPDLEAEVKVTLRRLAQVEQQAAQAGGALKRQRLQARLLKLTRRLDAQLSLWKQADERFHPGKNLAAAGRLLRGKLRRYNGDLSLAVASYHAGGGNIDRAIRLYFASALRRPPPPDRNRLPASAADRPLAERKALLRQRDTAFREALRRYPVRYLDLYNQESGPVYEQMARWSDYSRTYFWKVLAAADIAERYLSEPEAFRRESASAWMALNGKDAAAGRTDVSVAPASPKADL